MSFVFVVLVLVLFGLLSKLLDSTLGLGYGTLLVPLLLIFGYSVVRVIPAVLISEFLSSGLTAVLHRAAGNISGDVQSRDFKVSAVLSALGVIGAVIGVAAATNLSNFYVTMFVGLMVILTGMLVVQRFSWLFSWQKITAFGLIASFNKALSGGGYGTIIAGGQILSGRDGTRALGTTSVAEAATTGVSWILYFSLGRTLLTLEDVVLMDPYAIFLAFQGLEIPLVIGAVLSAPFSVYFVKELDSERITPLVGGASVILGVIILVKSMSGFGLAVSLTTAVIVLLIVSLVVVQYRNGRKETNETTERRM